MKKLFTYLPIMVFLLSFAVLLFCAGLALGMFGHGG